MASAAVLPSLPVNSPWICLSRFSVSVWCSMAPLAPSAEAMLMMMATLPALIIVAMALSRDCPVAMR